MAVNPTRSWSIERTFSKGQRLAREGDFDAAVAMYDKALSREGAYGGIHLHRGLALSAAGHHSGAIAALKRAVELEPRNGVFRLYQGLVLYDAGRDAEALVAAEEGGRLDPRNPFAPGLTALLLLRQNRAAEACALVLGATGRPIPPIEARLLAAATSQLVGPETDRTRRGEDIADRTSTDWGDALQAEVMLLAEALALLGRERSDSNLSEPIEDPSGSNTGRAVPDIGVYALTISALTGLQDCRVALADAYFQGLFFGSPLAPPDPRKVWVRRRRQAQLAATSDSLCLEAAILLSLRNYERAQQVVKEAISGNADSASPRFLQALMSSMLGRDEEALREFEEFTRESHGPALDAVFSALQDAVSGRGDS